MIDLAWLAIVAAAMVSTEAFLWLLERRRRRRASTPQRRMHQRTHVNGDGYH